MVLREAFLSGAGQAGCSNRVAQLTTRSSEPFVGDEMRMGKFSGRAMLAVAASCLIVGILVTASLNLVPLSKATSGQLWSEKRESGLFTASQISDGKSR